MDVKKDIYVEITIKAIKDGSEWQSTTVGYPRQTKDAYTVIEQTMGQALMSLDEVARNAGKK